MVERVEISKKLALINMASTIFTRFLSLAVLFWLQQYLLGKITYDEYSLQPLLYAIMMFAPLITIILTGGIGRFITVAYAKGDDEEVTRICSTMFPILCAACVAFLALGWTFSWYIDKVLNIAPELVWDARVMMALLMFSVAIQLPLLPFSTGFFVRQKFVLRNIIIFGCTLLRHALLLFLLFFVSTRLMWVIVAAVSAELLQLLIMVPISMRLVPALRFRPMGIHWPIAREITGFGGWQFVMAIGNTVRSAVDPIILNVHSSSWDLSCYHLATLPFQTLWQLISMAKTNLNPSLTAMHAAADQARLQNAFIRGNRIILWIFLLPSLPLAVLARPIFELYVSPEEWLAAVLLQINFFAMLTMIPSAMFASVAEATGKLREFCLLVLAAHMVNLGLTILFVVYLQMGAIGSCVATGVASAIFYPLFIWPLSRRTLDITHGTWLREVMWPGVLPALATLPILLPAAFFLTLDSLVEVLAVLALGGIVYVVCLYAWAAQKRDREDIQRVVDAARSRLTILFR